MGIVPRRHCAFSWSIRVNWPSSKLSPMPQPKPRKARLWQPTCGRCTLGGLPAGPMPRPPLPSMRAGGQDAVGAGRTRGGITPSAMTSWQRAAARAAPGEDGQRRRIHPDRVRLSRGGGGGGAV
jgi:hypothetical protein